MAARLGNAGLRATLSAASAKRLTDRELLAQFCAGDQSAFAAVVKRHTAMVFGVCRRVLPIVQDAEDACQATFLILAKKATTGRWQSSIANWLYITARRIALTANRAAIRRLRRESSPAPTASASALDQMTGREAFAALDEELDKLPAIYREPMVLFYLQGLTRNEASTRLGIPSATLKSRLDRGRKKLAEALSKRGIDVGAGLLAIAATSSVEASSQRLFTSILATAGGSPSATVTAMLKETAVNLFSFKAQMMALAATIVVATGFGIASMPIAAGPQQPAIVRTKQAASEYANSNAKRGDERPAAKANEPVKYKPIDPETIAAYEKLGGIHGGFELEDNVDCKLVPGKEADGKHLPGFQFVSSDGSLPKLPPVNVPFGLYLGWRELTDKNLEELKSLENLTTLILIGAQVTDEGLRQLKDLKNLTTLNLLCTKVTGTGVRELKNLRTLILWQTLATDEGVRALRDLKNLTTLDLSQTQVTDEGLVELRAFKNLTNLSLYHTKEVTDAGVRAIKDLKNLASLDLSGTQVTDKGLKELTSLKNLTALSLINTQVTDEGLKELKELKSLASLTLHHTQVTDLGMKELKELPGLTRLFLNDTRVTDEGLKELKNLKNLSQLYIMDTQVTDKGLAELKDLSNLTTLALGRLKVTDAGINKLKNLKKLKVLDLSETEVTGVGLHEFEELADLYLGSTKVTDDGLKQLKGLRKLTTLRLGETQVTDKGLKELKDLKDLNWLFLSGTHVTDEGLKELKDFKKLTMLQLPTDITEAAFMDLEKTLPKCKIMRGNVIYITEPPANP
jgi:RNA polymerase sigma factor (sigma-70 family)